MGKIFLILYISTIILANWLINTFGIIPIGFGLMAPAGVLAAGLAFTARDLTQEELGKKWTIIAVITGAALSYFISPQFALASGVAFLVSELTDFAVYTPIKKANFMIAVLLSNSVGLVVDSIIFLQLAFGSLDFVLGQVVGKFYMTILAIVLLRGLKSRGVILPLKK